MPVISRALRYGARVACVIAVAFAFAGAASAQDTLEKIKKSGKVTVGTEAAFPPFEMVKDGKIIGYGKDIIDYIVADMKVELVQLDVPFQGIFPGLLAGKFDFVATALLMNETTTKKFAFTMPFAEGTSSFAKRKGDESMKRVEDLNGKIVATQLGTGSEKIMRAVNEKFRAEGKGGFELKLFTSMPEAYLALANRQVDAVTSLLASLRALEARQPKVYEVVGPVIAGREYLGWACRPEDIKLRDYLSSKIKELRDSGKLAEMQQKWFGFTTELPDSGVPPGGI